MQGRRWNEVELLVGPLQDENLRQLLDLHVQVREGFGAQRGPIELERERHPGERRVDADHLARLEVEGVPDDQLAEAGQPRIGHQRTPTRTARLIASFVLEVFIEALIRIAKT